MNDRIFRVIDGLRERARTAVTMAVRRGIGPPRASNREGAAAGRDAYHGWRPAIIGGRDHKGDVATAAPACIGSQNEIARTADDRRRCIHHRDLLAALCAVL